LPHRVTSKPLTQGNHAEIVSANQYCQTFTPSEERPEGGGRHAAAFQSSWLAIHATTPQPVCRKPCGAGFSFINAHLGVGARHKAGHDAVG
ncbi:hypothetical protein PY365_23125, partial [Roseiarcaceae bacterium H3SJ34-1]|uniref:hypothetical protein n=1 Tax=Terripilifer ovatus TaxID=3032367 RepID=UPI003AB935E2|nr:hypothetical protein [Roseiarcaceae bacterium H3SJ34-1]